MVKISEDEKTVTYVNTFTDSDNKQQTYYFTFMKYSPLFMDSPIDKLKDKQNGKTNTED